MFSLNACETSLLSHKLPHDYLAFKEGRDTGVATIDPSNHSFVFLPATGEVHGPWGDLVS